MRLFWLSGSGGLETKGRLCGEGSYLPSMVRTSGDGGLIHVQGTVGRVCGGAIASVGHVSTARVEVLSKGVGFVVRDGRNVRFWLDDWVGLGPLCELFLRIFRVVSIKESIISDCYEMLDGFMVWDVSFRRCLCLSEEV